MALNWCYLWASMIRLAKKRIGLTVLGRELLGLVLLVEPDSQVQQIASASASIVIAIQVSSFLGFEIKSSPAAPNQLGQRRNNEPPLM